MAFCRADFFVYCSFRRSFFSIRLTAVVISSSGSNGFVMYASAPFFKPFILLSSLVSAVSKMIGTSLVFSLLRTLAVNSNPSIRGIIMSLMMRSACRSSSVWSASIPSMAVYTVNSLCIVSRRYSMTSASSSTISTLRSFIGCAASSWYALPLPSWACSSSRCPGAIKSSSQ